MCLSATVSNAEEFAAWIGTVAGRPPPSSRSAGPSSCDNLFMVGDRSSEHVHLFPTFVDGQAQPGGRPSSRRARRSRPRDAGPAAAAPLHAAARRGRRPVVERRHAAGHLLHLQPGRLRRRGAAVPRRRPAAHDARGARARSAPSPTPSSARLSDEDLDALGYTSWMAGLEAGFAAHHAGMVPPFKEVVEAAFTAALVKVVFATETLSLGINMPARTVVHREDHQVHRRAATSRSRRGSTPSSPGGPGAAASTSTGYAVVLWSPFVPFDQVASLGVTPGLRADVVVPAHLQHGGQPRAAIRARRRAPPAQPELRPVPRRQRGRARRGPAREAARRAGRRRGAADVRAGRRRSSTARCARRPSGPRSACRRPTTRSSSPSAVCSRATCCRCRASRRGAGSRCCRRAGGAAATSASASSPQDNRVLSLGPKDFRAPPRPVGRVELPDAVHADQAGVPAPGRPGLAPGPPAHRRTGRRGRSGGRRSRPRHAAVAAHPVAGVPRRRDARAPRDRRAADLRRRIARLERADPEPDGVAGPPVRPGAARARGWGYVDGWSLTDAGEISTATYHETDLLVAESLRSGCSTTSIPTSLAGLASVFTFETRGRDAVARAAQLPDARGARAVGRHRRAGRRAQRAEKEAACR